MSKSRKSAGHIAEPYTVFDGERAKHTFAFGERNDKAT